MQRRRNNVMTVVGTYRPLNLCSSVSTLQICNLLYLGPEPSGHNCGGAQTFVILIHPHVEGA